MLRVTDYGLLISLLLTLALPAAAEVVYVCDAGDSSNPTSGDTATAYTSIQGAINAVDPGDGYDTIVVYSTVIGDSYWEQVDIEQDTGLTLISYKALFGSDTGGGLDTYPIIANDQVGSIIFSYEIDVIVNGFIIDGSNRSSHGVNISNFQNLTVTNLIVRNCDEGITISGGSNFSISNCLAYENNGGFSFGQLGNGSITNNQSANNLNQGFYFVNDIQGCTIANNLSYNNHNWGFYLDGVETSTIANNSSNGDSECGFYFSASHSNLVTGNQALNIANGYEATGFYFSLSSGNAVFDNQAYGNEYDGFGGYWAENNTFIGNKVANNGRYGFVFFNYSYNNYVAQNDVDSNGGYGYCILNSSVDNRIEKNNWSPGTVYPDSGVRYATNDTGVNYFYRNYWGTGDSSAISNLMHGVSADSIIWQPYRLGTVDTTANADTMAPAAPTVVSAQTDNGICTLSWSPTTVDEETGNPVADLAGYRIYRALQSDTGDWGTPIGQTGAGDTDYVDSGLALLVDYYYRVTAFDNHTPCENESWYSDSIVRINSLPAGSMTVFVCDAGDSSNPSSGDTATAYTSIQGAINAVDPGDGYDTIVVYSSVNSDSYWEAVVLAGNDTGLTLVSYKALYGIDTGGGADTYPVVFYDVGMQIIIMDCVDDVSIDGFKLMGNVNDAWPWHGVWKQRGNRIRFNQLIIQGCRVGISIGNGEFDAITNCISNGLESGFGFADVSNADVSGNHVWNNQNGVGYYGLRAYDCTITNNTSENGFSWGFNFVSVCTSTISNNVSRNDFECGYYFANGCSLNDIEGNQAIGVAGGYEPAGLYFNGGQWNLIQNNIVADCDSDGFGFWGGAQNNTFINNVVTNSGRHGFALFANGANNNYFAQNQCDSSGGYGYWLQSGNSNNTFLKNNWSSGALNPDSAIYSEVVGGTNAFYRNYWGTSDSGALGNMIHGPAADSILWQPYRLGMVDTAAGADTIAPAAPATGEAQAINDVCTITWSPSITNEEDGSGLADLAGYRIYRAIQADTSSWGIPIGETNSSDTQYVDSGIIPGVAYYYRITAFDNNPPAENESWYSSILAGLDTAAPVVTISAPAEGSGTTVSGVWVGGTISDEMDTPTTVILTTDEGYQTVTVPTADGCFGDTVYLYNNGYHVITVSCTDVSGNSGLDTVGINVNDTSITLYPLAPADQGYTNDHTPEFSWYSTADTYLIEISRDALFSAIIDSNVQNDTDYIPGAAYDADTYYWRVIGSNQSGNSETMAAQALYINPDTADLTVTAVNCETDQLYLAHSYQFTGTVKNVGIYGFSGNIQLDYYLSHDPQLDAGDSYFGSVAVPSLTLAAGAESTVTAALTIPETATINHLYLFAALTAADSGSENNNGRSMATVSVGAHHDFLPDRDGWGFANGYSWSGGAFPNWTIFKMAFGANTVEYPDGTPKEYALQYFHDIQGGWYGSCFGFSLSSLLYHNGTNGLPGGYSELYSVPCQTEYTNVLHSYQLYYYGENQFRTNEQTYRKPISEFLADIVTGLLPANGDEYKELEFRSGVWHSVVPFKVIHDSDTGSNKYRLYVYENNNPGWVDRAINLDADANTWNYYNSPWGSLSGSGGNGSIFCAPVSYGYTRPQIPSSYSEGYVGMANVAALQVYSDGILVADYDDTGFSSLSDSVTGFVPPAAYGDTNLVGIYITLPQPYTIVVSEVEDAGSPYDVSLYSGGRVVNCQAVLAGGSDSVTFNDSECNVVAGMARDITVTVNHFDDVEEKLFTVKNFALTAGDSLAVCYSAADSIGLATTADTGPLFLELEYHTNGQHQLRRVDSFTVAPRAEVVVENADWVNLGTSIVIEINYSDDTGLNSGVTVVAPLVIGDTTIIRLNLPMIFRYDTAVMALVNDLGSSVCLGVPVYNTIINDYGETIDLDIDFAGNDTGQRITVRRVGADSCTAQGVDNYTDYATTMFDFSVADSVGLDIGADPARFNSIGLTFHFDPGNYAAADLAALTLFSYNPASGQWEAVEGAATDPQTGLITAQLAHFSIYGIFPAVGFAAPATNLNNVTIYPNPYQPNDGNPVTGSSYTGQGNSSGIYINGLVPGTKIEIYDLRGRMVEEISVPAGTGAVQWDARNSGGDEVASGVYFVLFKNGSEVVTKKLFIVR